MLKRKILAGGYQDSSDDDNGFDGLKRPKLVPYAPPRLATASRLGLGTFQLPGSSGSLPRMSVPPSRHVSVSSSSGQPTPVPESVQNVRNTPEIRIGASLDLMSGGSTSEPSGAADLRMPKSTAESNSMPSLTYQPNNSRSNLTLERQINGLIRTLEEYKQASEERQKANDVTLKLILETLDRLESMKNTTATSQAPTDMPSILSNLPNTSPLLSNPAPTSELIAIISKVVTEARSRVGKKKGGAEDNSCKEHAQTTFYRMLGITAAREVRPYFEDEYGEPDTLPTQFVDPNTGYCPPYPHWKAPLTKQVAWVPTFILRFKSTIPSGQSELSNVLRGLSDEAIVILLHDGPFKLATTAWRDAKKSDTKVEAMRSNARRYQRCDRKAAVRGGYIKAIPSLKGSDWEYLSHPGYMSQDESDDEGVLITKRSESRAQWETNLYDAIFMAEHVKARSKPGLCPRLPDRSVKLMKQPIPHLERGTGGGKVTIRIAICGLSSHWRQQHPDELRKNAHLLNMRATAKPNISVFLGQHPMSTIDDQNDSDGDEYSRHDGGLGYPALKTEGSPAGKESTVGTTSDQANCTVACHDLIYDGEEESGAILDMSDTLLGYGAMGAMRRSEIQELVEDEEDSDLANFKIDPQLIAVTTSTNSKQPDALLALPTDNTPLTFYSSEMTPPPLLNPKPNPVPSQTTTINEPPSHIKVKKIQGRKSGGVVPDTGELERGDSLLSGVLHPKRRGRPPGSKNKPKV